MVLSASSALQITTTAISTTTANNLAQEITAAEGKIRLASTQEQYQVLYTATIIGNPPGDPNNNATPLTPIQVDFKAAFQTAGYTVGWDASSGNWLLSWQTSGAETQVNVYTVWTSATLSGGTVTAIKAAISGFFTSQTPTFTNVVEYVGSINSLNPSETFTIVVSPIGADLSSELLAMLIANNTLGLNSGNTFIYRAI